MGRLHTHNHGKSHSIRPVDPKKPDWVKQTKDEIEGLIIKYAKEGMTTSQIGLKLRDQHAIPLVKPIIRKGIKQVLIPKDNGKDLVDMPKKIIDDIKITLVEHVDEVLKIALIKELKRVEWVEVDKISKSDDKSQASIQ